ncbi:MAG: UDP-N-acetylmuramoyl-tripeptide--D-alanyl-D-alanine ligase, partial [Gammaproteobacteria bacterium]|nr:UDP-N-acetylmuramoyl-tripeptide--D-alanyl-D-alanine ligase [Gammaproteobacteria bacterium]
MVDINEIVETTVLKHWQLSELASVLSAQLKGNDVSFDSVSTDTRSIGQNALFIALVGPNFDGHDFVEAAQRLGAVALLVSKEVESSLPQIIVKDTRLALGQFAAAWRAGFNIPVVGVTGSNGKTTVKEMIAAILGQTSSVLMTQGNLNNDIGLPLTLLNMTSKHQYAVIEMGANHAGEIDYLTQITKPDIAVITNAAAAHLEGFGSVEGVAHAKGEIFGGLSANGVGIINADDAYADLWSGLLSRHKMICFGIEKDADVSAIWQGDARHSDVEIKVPGSEFKCVLPVPGKHNVMNALVATAVA